MEITNLQAKNTLKSKKFIPLVANRVRQAGTYRRPPFCGGSGTREFILGAKHIFGRGSCLHYYAYRKRYRPRPLL